MILQSSIPISMLGLRRLSSTVPRNITSKFVPLRHSLTSFAIRPRFSKIRAFGVAAVAAESTKCGDTFFAEESISWASLGVSDGLARALSEIGLHRPSLVQVCSGIRVILCWFKNILYFIYFSLFAFCYFFDQLQKEMKILG